MTSGKSCQCGISASTRALGVPVVYNTLLDIFAYASRRLNPIMIMLPTRLSNLRAFIVARSSMRLRDYAPRELSATRREMPLVEIFTNIKY